MIASVKGKLETVTVESVIIDVNGFGVESIVPSAVFNYLPKIGDDIRLYTYLHVREDIMQLYGFLEKEDLEFFKLLITVNGIGPKAGIAILSSIPTDILTFAILSEDIKTIEKAQGIGAKTAKKLVLELKDKVGIINNKTITSENHDYFVKESINNEVKGEAVEVLIALGYSRTESMKAISQIEFAKDITAEELVKLALKNLM